MMWAGVSRDPAPDRPAGSEDPAATIKGGSPGRHSQVVAPGSSDPGGQWPVACLRVSGRRRHVARVEAWIRSVERVRSSIDRLAQIVDVAVDEAALHAAAVDDVDLVAFAGRD